MGFVHYQTLEAVSPRDLRALYLIKEQFNSGRNSSERIKLWRKADIFRGMEPRDARWGFTRVRDEWKRLMVISALKLMSTVTPRLTWILCDWSNNGREIVLRGGKLTAVL